MMSETLQSTPDSFDLAWMQTRIRASIAVKQALLESTPLLEQLLRAGGALAERLRAGGKLLVFGNGGSAADAQHIAAELVGRFYEERRALPALALTANSSSVTALGNDYGYERVFARQVQAFGAPGDAALGLSTSGGSPNVLAAIQAARAAGLYTLALTGADGRELQSAAHECICVPSRDTPRIQESHILIGHLLCEYIEQALFGDQRP